MQTTHPASCFRREWMGVEPTEAGTTPPSNGFEDRGTHRGPTTPIKATQGYRILRIWSSRNPRRDNPHFGRTILGMVHRVPKRGRKHLQNWPAMTSSGCPSCNPHANTIADNAELCYNHTLKARPSPNRGFPAYIAPFGSKHEPALLLTYSNSICSIFRGEQPVSPSYPPKKLWGKCAPPELGARGSSPS